MKWMAQLKGWYRRNAPWLLQKEMRRMEEAYQRSAAEHRERLDDMHHNWNTTMGPALKRVMQLECQRDFSQPGYQQLFVRLTIDPHAFHSLVGPGGRDLDLWAHYMADDVRHQVEKRLRELDFKTVYERGDAPRRVYWEKP